MKQSINNSSYDPLFFKRKARFNYSFFSSYSIGLRYNTKLPKNLDLKIVYKGLTGKSLDVTKRSIFTASPFLLEIYRMFPYLYFDEKTITLLQQT